MSRAKTIIGAMAVCALALAAFGASSAFATPPGLTAVACEEAEPKAGAYEDAHCQEEAEPGKGEYETAAVENGTEITSIGENPRLTATIGLAKIAIECEASHSAGEVTNVVEEEEMRAHGTNIVVEYTGNCHARLESHPEESCPIEGGSITTEPLTALSGPEHKVTIKPEGGELFTQFTILHEGGSCTNLPELEIFDRRRGDRDRERRKPTPT